MDGSTSKDPRRAIPSVDRLLASAAFQPLLATATRRRVVEALQQVQREVRRRRPPPADLADEAMYARLVRERLAAQEQSSLVPVINATGVILHTNLGRAPLAPAALAAMARVAAGYASLEYDLDAGQRGSRYLHCAGLLRQLTGAEDALVVNNNAAALVLALSALARGRGAIVSRGELVEIGDSFRIAEIVQKSGATLVEIGSTNRTHLSDYEKALGPDAAAILKVNRSNFRVTGFTAEATLGDLAELAAGRLPVIADLGSGLLVDAATLGLPHEPTPREALHVGADLVTMSGDKLLGGPQAGIILGRADLVAALRRDPLCRALRVDKLTLAALEATLRIYLDPERALKEIPTLRMIAMSADEIGQRAAVVRARLRRQGVPAELREGSSSIGGGAYPDLELATVLVALDTEPAAHVEARLRSATPPVVARILEERVCLDLRTVAPGEEDALLEAVVAAHA